MPDDKCIVSVAGLPNKSDAPYFESTGNVFCKNKWHPYNAERLRSGSVVGIHHNLETNELEFSVDGVKRGVAFFGLPKETSFRLIAECNAPGKHPRSVGVWFLAVSDCARFCACAGCVLTVL